MKLRFPTPIINTIINQINIDLDFNKAPETVKQKLFTQCINLWWFIHNEQYNDDNITSFKGYTNINYKQLNKYCIHYKKNYSYKKFLDVLISCGLVEVNNKYSTGNFSKSYRVKIDFNTGVDTTEIEIDFKAVFINTKNKSYWLKLYPQYTDLIKDCYRAKIDLNSYVKWLYDNVGIKLKCKYNDNGFIEERYLTPDRVIKYINSAIKINVGNLWFGTSDQGRFYNSIAGLSSTAIPFLLLNKQPLVSLDITNSQPLILATLIDCPAYTRACEEGLFYKSIIDHINEPKDKVKLMIMKTFFKETKCLSGKMVDCLNSLFPGLLEQVNDLKDKINLAHLLHKIEADIIVNGCGQLDFPKLLRHDQVLVYSQNQNEVKEYIINEFKRRKVKVKISR